MAALSRGPNHSLVKMALSEAMFPGRLLRVYGVVPVRGGDGWVRQRLLELKTNAVSRKRAQPWYG